MVLHLASSETAAVCTACIIAILILYTQFSLLPPAHSVDNLELLSTIQEIRGPLRIQFWDGESFPYLRNLRVIGAENATTINAPCSGVSCKYLEYIRLSVSTLSSIVRLVITTPQLTLVS